MQDFLDDLKFYLHYSKMFKILNYAISKRTFYLGTLES